jgi:hypothetical protein
MEETVNARLALFTEEQDRFAREVEALSDDQARHAYHALLMIVHQLTRAKHGLGKPSVPDDPDVLADSFEDYFHEMDLRSSEELIADFQTVRSMGRSVPDAQTGVTAFQVVVLSEIIRREAVAAGTDGMLGYERVQRMMQRLQRSV